MSAAVAVALRIEYPGMNVVKILFSDHALLYLVDDGHGEEVLRQREPGRPDNYAGQFSFSESDRSPEEGPVQFETFREAIAPYAFMDDPD